MIITLKGANFANSNIGTLSSWTVSRVLGDGATYNGDTFVNKNAALNATVTIAEGYRLENNGVTVTMNGQVLESCFAISGKTITINIASVTGNVIIKVSTVDLNADKNVDFALIEGMYLSGDGSLKSLATWNVSDYIEVYPESVYTYYGNTAVGNGAIPSVYAYDANKKTIQALFSDTDGTNGFAFKTTSNTAYIKLCSHRDTELKLEYTPDKTCPFAVAYVKEGYISNTGAIFNSKANWTRTEYIDVSETRSIKYTGTVPEGGLATVAAVYGYDANRNPIEMILAPSITEHVNGYVVNITNENIKYITACAYTKNGEAFSITLAE